MKDFQDQVVLITGAGAGIGLEAARQFGQQGAHLALGDINTAQLERSAAQLRELGIRVFAQACDVTDEAQVSAFVSATVSEYGRIDAAVNNAGIDPPHNLLADMPVADFDRTLEVNVKGVFLCMKYQIPQLLAQGGGAICNLSSVAGLGGAPGMAAYAASKHAVLGLSKSAAFEYGTRGIRVNSVCPFITQTAMLDQSLALVPNKEEALAAYTAGTAMKRIAQPEEVAVAILFACHKQNSFMTGQELVVDGGMTSV